jgi:P-type Ca2+ transporter type 2C
LSTLVEEHNSGLTAQEAKVRLAKYGPNLLVVRERAAWLKEIAKLFFDPMAIMLLATAGVYLALGATRDATVMLVALAPVIGVDVLLEARSRTALKKLARGVAPRARVVRDGRETVVETATLVPGDLLMLAEGEFIHADGVVRSAANLAIDESSLTGEAEPQRKQPTTVTALEASPVEARFYAGSVVLAGQGQGEILATGGATRFGEIARLIAAADTSATPLQRRVGRLVKKLALTAGVVAVGVFGLGLLRGMSWERALLGGISLAMSAAPEEFPLVFTLFLSVGAWRLGRHGVLVRRLASVETLGSTTVICTDKTGTLTQGQFVLDEVISFRGIAERDLLEAAVLACESPPNDPMEKAIDTYAAEHGVDLAKLLGSWRLTRDYDFDPIGKHMSHVWSSVAEPTRVRVVAKGALEGIVEHARLSEPDRIAIDGAHARLAAQGFRVLALAERIGGASPSTREADEEGLSLLGLLGFRDPLRPEVPNAVRECQAAGIRIKVVTGDHPLTAHAIAESAGIHHRDDSIVTGGQLAQASGEDLRRLIVDADILSRITPAQKHMIVEVLRDEGEIVAMTGDGINDAPALRRADIGVSMGRRGTDVARAAADLVLLDDNFASIVAAVREGRKIFLDIQRAFLYLLAFHVPIVGLALIAPILGMPLLLLPIHFVWLELIVHPASAFLFQGDPAPEDLMRRPPRDPRAPMLPRADVIRSIVSGSMLTVVVFLVYRWKLGQGVGAARGLALASLILGYQLLAIAERAAFMPGPRALLPRSARFWVVWGATGLSLPVLMYVPGTAALMGIERLFFADWLTAAGAATLAIGWRLAVAFRPRRKGFGVGSPP